MRNFFSSFQIVILKRFPTNNNRVRTPFALKKHIRTLVNIGARSPKLPPPLATAIAYYFASVKADEKKKYPFREINGLGRVPDNRRLTEIR